MALTKGTTVGLGFGISSLTSYPFTTSGYYRGLTVAVMSQTALPLVKFNGVSMVQGASILFAASPNTYATFFYLANPSSGTYNIDIDPNGGFVTGSYATQFNGVDQTTMAVDAQTRTSLGTWTFTTSVADVWLAFAGGTFASHFNNGTDANWFSQAVSQDMGFSTATMGAAGAKSVVLASSSASALGVAGMSIVPAVMVPVSTTSAVSNIALRSVRANGSIDYDGASTITERGFVISTSPAPTTSNTKVTALGTTGTYFGDFTGLSVNTTYYVRAYAINANGTGYGSDVSFTTSNITSTEMIKDISGVEGGTYAVSIDVTGTLGSITVQLGRSGTSATFTAAGGTQTMQGTYSGIDGIIITRSGTFNGTVDNVRWVRVVGTGTINWSSTNYTTVFAIPSEVYFKRIEGELFDNFVFYRQLELIFKDFNGYVTVTLKEERDDIVTSKTKTFSVGNTTSPASPFSKKRISMLCKDQAIIIGLSNASVNETFAIAKFILSGHKRPRKTFSSGRIISIGG